MRQSYTFEPVGIARRRRDRAKAILLFHEADFFCAGPVDDFAGNQIPRKTVNEQEVR